MTVVPGTVQMLAGGSGRVTVRVTPDVGFSGDVTLEVRGLPTGATASFERPSTGGGDVALDFTTPGGLPSGDHLLTVAGRSGTIERSTTMTLELVDPGGGAFDIDVDVRALAVDQGGTVSTFVRQVPTVGAPPPAVFSIEAASGGWSATFSPHGSGVTMTLSPDATVAPGTHELTVAGVAAGRRQTTTVLAHVRRAPIHDGLGIQAPTVLQVRRNGATAALIDVERDPGVVGDVGVQIDGVPVGVTATFDQDPVRTASTTLRVTAGALAPVGEHVLTVTVTQNAWLGTAQVLLQVVGDEPLADARIQRVEFAQSFFSRDPGLVGGKPALLRAHVVADRAGVVAPVVRVEGFLAGASLGTFDLAGPSVLGLGEDAANLSQSFRADLPAAWVRDGVELQVTLDPDHQVADREERNDRVHVVPGVGAQTQIELVVVPLRIAGREAQPDDYRADLLAMWPLQEVSITVHAPYAVTSVPDVSSNGDGWAEVLGEVSALRSTEGSSAYYFGVVPVSYSGGVAGLGYLGYPVAIGWNRSRGVILHEIGHNFGLRHAPCGGPSSTDPAYPFLGGVIGEWGFDSRSDSLIDPRAAADLMSYCRPEWVSGYNHQKVRDRLGGASLISGAGAGEDVPLLLVRGRIGRRDAVELAGVQRMHGAQAALVPGDLTLRLTFGGGRSASFPVATVELGCGGDPEQRHFSACVPDPGELEALEIRRGDRVLYRAVSRRPSIPFGVAAAESGLGLDLVERDGSLRASWDATAWPRIGIVHVAGRRRTALAVALGGGAADLSLVGVPPGGEFEVSASSGIDGFTVRVQR